jgi:hypothetical protein
MKKVVTLFMSAFLLSAGLVHAQERSTLSIKDLDSGIEKYIKKNYEGYRPVEAFKHEAVYEMKTQKVDAVEWLLFNQKGKFVKKEAGSKKDKMPSQMRTTLATKDVPSEITKYIKNTEYNLIEAYMYEEVTEVRIMKGAETERLVFDKDGEFLMKATPKPVEPAKKADSVPMKKEEPKKADTVKK